MIINNIGNSNVSIESIEQILLNSFKQYDIKLKEKNRNGYIYIVVDKNYQVIIKLEKNRILINYDIKGCLLIMLPTYLLGFFLPKAKVYEKEIGETLFEEISRDFPQAKMIY